MAGPEFKRDGVDFTLVLPTYNERENLAEVFDRIDRALKRISFEVILVDDDSPDKTWQVAEQFQQQYPWLHVIRRRGARGLSSAAVCGFRHASGKILGVMDADLQHDITLLPELLQKAEWTHFVVASRRTEGGSHGTWSAFRLFASGIATCLARLITRVPFSDPMSGFFVVRRDTFESIDDGRLAPRGYKILIYLYTRATQLFGKKAIRFREVGYHFGNRAHGRSKLNGKVIFDYLLMLLELRFRPNLRHARVR